jgi:hypothetical protein
MHETLSKNFIGNIDSIKKEGRNYLIEGWIVPLLETNACVIGCENFISITPLEREDIYLKYKQQHINFLRCGFKLLVLPERQSFIIKANGEDIFKIEVDLTEFVLTPNNFCSQELLVIDDFYNDPVAARNYALSVDYTNSKTRFNGLQSIKRYVPFWMAPRFEALTGKKFKEYTRYAGTFILCSSTDLIAHNFLDADYLAVIGLTQDIKEEVGLSTFKSKLTNLTHKAKNSDAHAQKSTIQKLNQDSFGDNVFDRTNLIEVDKIMFKFNRLILINAKTLHSQTFNTGNQKENSLLFHYFPFNVYT